MKPFLKYLKESNQIFDKTVAIVADSFKPCHAGHWDMIQQYANKADEVIVLISDPKSEKSIRKTNLGTVVTPEMSKEIFNIYINRYNLQDKVKVEISTTPSPVKAMYDYIDQNLHNVNVIFGVSKKGGDYKRFLSAPKYYADNPEIHVLDPLENAVEPFENNGIPISATDIRNHIDEPEFIKPMLPSKLTSGDVKQIIKILSDGASLNEDEEIALSIPINDNLLKKCFIYAYDVGMQTVDDKNKKIPINPKKFPEKAVCLKIPIENGEIEIYLETETAIWKSKYIINNQAGILSEEQMKQFFSSKVYRAITMKLKKNWPLTDEKYNKLYTAIVNKIPMDSDDELSNECDGMISSTTPKGAIGTGDILGKNCDHKNNGFFGKDCNHIPKSIFKEPMRRFDIQKKNKKKKQNNFVDEGEINLDNSITPTSLVDFIKYVELYNYENLNISFICNSRTYPYTAFKTNEVDIGITSLSNNINIEYPRNLKQRDLSKYKKCKVKKLINIFKNIIDLYSMDIEKCKLTIMSKPLKFTEYKNENGELELIVYPAILKKSYIKDENIKTFLDNILKSN